MAPSRCPFASCGGTLLHHSFARKIRHFELLHQRETQFKCFVNKCIYAGSCIKSLCTHLQDCHARNHLKEATLGPLAATFENFKFKCVINTCGVVHNTVSRLKAHLFRHHKELKKDCIYSGCRYSTSNCFTLKSHFSRMHNSQCAAGFALLNLPKGKSLGRSKPETNSSNEQAH